MSSVFDALQLQRIAQAIEDGQAGATATATVNLDFSNVGDMTGATTGTAGTHGLVPAPAAGDQDKTLHGDGTWRAGAVDLPQVFGSGSGSIITLTDAADYAASDLVIDIDPVQSGSGNPSPDNIRPISGWTGANVVVSPTLNAQDGTTYSIAFPSEAGTVYGGTLDVTNGTLTVTHKCVDFGEYTWTKTTNAISYVGFYAVISDRRWRTASTVISSNYKATNNVRTQLNNNEIGVFNTNSIGSFRQVLVRDDTFASYTPEQVREALDGVQYYYEIATPQTYQLTPTEVQMLLGTNNLWADTGDIITLEYIKSDYNDLMRAVPKMKMPDYSAAISSGTYNLYDGFNYTAVKDCIIYIMIGCDSGQSYPSVSVNNNSLGYIWSNTSGIEIPLFIPLKAGDVLDVSATTQGNNWTENYIVFALN